MKIKCAFMVVALALLASCHSNKEMVYFQDIDQKPELLESRYKEYAVKVKPADELLITVRSEVPEATAIYNMPQVDYVSTENAASVNSSNARILSYVVDKDGYINFPVIGKINVGGLTTSEITDLLTQHISKDVHDPYVRVQLATFRVNVLGEVAEPGAMEVTTERYSILDAISDAGDLTQYGRRENVLLIREVDGNRTYHRIDLTNTDILTSPYFYLQQNDVVYVEPNDVRKSNAAYDQNKSYKVQVATAATSAISVIVSLIIALTR